MNTTYAEPQADMQGPPNFPPTTLAMGEGDFSDEIKEIGDKIANLDKEKELELLKYMKEYYKW